MRHTAAQPPPPPVILSNRRALRFPFLFLFPPLVCSWPSFPCHLASWCEHMPGACGTIPLPQSTIHLQSFPLHLPFPLLWFFLGLRFLSIYFCFCRFRSTFLMPVKHENAFAIPTFTCIHTYPQMPLSLSLSPPCQHFILRWPQLPFNRTHKNSPRLMAMAMATVDICSSVTNFSRYDYVDWVLFL